MTIGKSHQTVDMRTFVIVGEVEAALICFCKVVGAEELVFPLLYAVLIANLVLLG